jgi:hypothetical protein
MYCRSTIVEVRVAVSVAELRKKDVCTEGTCTRMHVHVAGGGKVTVCIHVSILIFMHLCMSCTVQYA